MKRTWFDRKPTHKGFKKTGTALRKTRVQRRDQGQVTERRTSLVDTQFGKIIKERDGWTCKRCGEDFSEKKDQLTCSHFVNVRHSACRYDADNCIALCQPCHTGRRGWEYRKAEGQAYWNFMVDWLGRPRFDALMARKHSHMHLSAAKDEFFRALRKEIL